MRILNGLHIKGEIERTHGYLNSNQSPTSQMFVNEITQEFNLPLGDRGRERECTRRVKISDISNWGVRIPDDREFLILQAQNEVNAYIKRRSAFG